MENLIGKFTNEEGILDVEKIYDWNEDIAKEIEFSLELRILPVKKMFITEKDELVILNKSGLYIFQYIEAENFTTVKQSFVNSIVLNELY